MGRVIAAVALAAVFGFAAAAASGAGTTNPLKPGDVLVYDLGIDLHVQMSPAPGSTQPPVSMLSSANGTETLTVRSADPDGSLNTTVDVELNASGAPGGRRTFSQTMNLKMRPDGSTEAGPGASPELVQYVKAIGDATRLYRGKKLFVGETFKQTVSLPGPVPFTVATTAKVVGQKTYRGYPTFAIQTTGNGTMDTTLEGMHVTGTFDTAGTTYVDQRDQLFVGEAMRSNVRTALGGAQGYHVLAVATIDFALRSFRHGVRLPAAAPSPVPAPVPSTAPSSLVSPPATPAPSPTATSGYYTPPPPSPSPST